MALARNLKMGDGFDFTTNPQNGQGKHGENTAKKTRLRATEMKQAAAIYLDRTDCASG
jgi:hypothetical protein